MSNALSIFAIIISGCSFLFAVLSFRKSHNLGKRQLEIDEERRSDERSASLVAYFHKDEKRRTLRIENKGNGEARNIKVIIDGSPIEQHPAWVQNQPNRVSVLCGQGYGDYILGLSSSTPFPQIAEVYWEDDIKKDNISRNSLTI
jgi:hypothetical protein